MEVRPIDANAAIEAIEKREKLLVGDRRVGVEHIKTFISNRPTLDYAPVRRGEWEDGAFENSKKCTSCGRYSSKIYTANSPIFDYVICPYCGAKMGGYSDE